jgi:hypothetical protein
MFYGALVQPAHAHVGTIRQAGHIVELGLHAIGSLKKRLSASDKEDAGEQHCQAGDNEQA